MSQHDMAVANDTGAAVRADLNNALVALVGLSSGASAPATTFAYMFWADTSAGLLKQRNAANSGWVTKGVLADASAEYATGTFTPTFEGSTGAGTYTYTQQVGRYTKVGNRVFYQLRLAVSAVGGGAAGDMRIAGIPVTPVAVADAINPASVGIAKFNLDTGYTQLCAYVDPTTSRIVLSQIGDNVAHANLTASGLLNDSQITISGHYEI